MAPQLGKRKRVTREQLERPSRSPSPEESSNDEDVQELFRRAFEKKFKPLDVEPVTSEAKAKAKEKEKEKEKETPVEEEEEEEVEEHISEAEDDWSGLSDDDDMPKVEVIEYKDTTYDDSDEATSKALKRAFMTSKPPTSTSMSTKSTSSLSATKKEPTDADDTGEVANLKNDLALQKLLRDSHILSASSSGASTPNLTTSGAARHKSTDLHLQSLGARGSVFTQKKMPMAQRKHMATVARTTEAKRRHEAREGGIILEKEKREPRRDERKRERSVGGPSIGKFKGGTLSLSKKDVKSITGGPGSQGGKGKWGKSKGKPRR
ncbi:hypothetical protein B5807_10451 [Epicoccum nigrum]|uniref:Protein FAF1 n=1 Tax=Epicoccum nigrum TaxID=105696 RepID=A0A1Y2LMX5_EPING|nr:hypothetical protein B5807_10451 [Epicoccum nigrum]